MANTKYEVLQSMMIASILGEGLIKSEIQLDTLEHQQAIVRALVVALDLGIALIAEMDGMDEEEVRLRGEAAHEKILQVVEGLERMVAEGQPE